MEPPANLKDHPMTYRAIRRRILLNALNALHELSSGYSLQADEAQRFYDLRARIAVRLAR